MTDLDLIKIIYVLLAICYILTIKKDNGKIINKKVTTTII